MARQRSFTSFVLTFALVLTLAAVDTASAVAPSASGAGLEHPGVGWVTKSPDLDGWSPIRDVDWYGSSPASVVTIGHVTFVASHSQGGSGVVSVSRQTGQLTGVSTREPIQSCGLAAGPEGRVWYATERPNPDGTTVTELVGIDPATGNVAARWSDPSISGGCSGAIQSLGFYIVVNIGGTITRIHADTGDLDRSLDPSLAGCGNRAVVLPSLEMAVTDCYGSVGLVEFATGEIHVQQQPSMEEGATGGPLLEQIVPLDDGFLVPLALQQDDESANTLTDWTELLRYRVEGTQATEVWRLAGPRNVTDWGGDGECFDFCGTEGDYQSDANQNPCQDQPAAPCHYLYTALHGSTLVAAQGVNSGTRVFAIDVGSGKVVNAATHDYRLLYDGLLGVDANGWVWMTAEPPQDGFYDGSEPDPSQQTFRIVAANVDGRTGGTDTDGDGVLEHAFGEFRTWTVTGGRYAGNDPERGDDYAPTVGIMGAAPLANDGTIYAWANVLLQSFQTYDAVFELVDVAPGQDPNDPADGTSSSGGDTTGDGGSTGDPGGTNSPGGASERPPSWCVFPPGERIAGSGPVDTATALSQNRFPEGTARHAVLSRDDRFPDSLSGAALTSEGPLLFTPTSQLHTATRAELERALPPGATVYLLGGEAALSSAVEQAVRDAGFSPRRLAGADRIATSLAVANEVLRLYGNSTQAALARAWGRPDSPSSGWADSVAASSWAADQLVPVLLTPTDHLDSRVADLLTGMDVGQTVLLGGQAALSSAVEAAAPNPRRISGANRESTAIAISRELWNVANSGDRCYLVVNGWHDQGWAYGLAAGGFASDRQAPVLLTSTDVVPQPTLDEVRAAAPCEVLTLAVGPETIVPRARLDEIDAAAGGGCDDSDATGGTADGAGGATPGDSGGTPGDSDGGTSGMDDDPEAGIESSTDGITEIQDPLVPGVHLPAGARVEIIGTPQEPQYPLRIEVSREGASQATVEVTIQEVTNQGTPEQPEYVSAGTLANRQYVLDTQSGDGTEVLIAVDSVALGKPLTSIGDLRLEVAAKFPDGTVSSAVVAPVHPYTTTLLVESVVSESSSNGDFQYDGTVQMQASLPRSDPETLDRTGFSPILYLEGELTLAPSVHCTLTDQAMSGFEIVGGNVHPTLAANEVSLDYSTPGVSDITMACDDGQQRSIDDPWWQAFALGHQEDAAAGEEGRYLRATGWSDGSQGSEFSRVEHDTDQEHGTTPDGHTWTLDTTWEILLTDGSFTMGPTS